MDVLVYIRTARETLPGYFNRQLPVLPLAGSFCVIKASVEYLTGTVEMTPKICPLQTYTGATFALCNEVKMEGSHLATISMNRAS